jgi:putative ABC transport system permease protein
VRPPGEPQAIVILPTGAPAQLVVVGVYEPSDRTDPYWGATGKDFLRPGEEPLLTDRRTLTMTPHQLETQTVIAYPRPGTVVLDSLASLPAEINGVLSATAEFSPSTAMLALIDKIQQDNRTVSLVAGVATVPLVALCWYVLYLAIASAANSRRTELGMVKLRGLSTGGQWWIVAAESVLPVLAGAVIGYLLGHLVIRTYFWHAPVSVPVTMAQWQLGATAVAGAVLAGLLAMRRDLASSATELLRGVPALRRGWRGLSAALLVAAAATLSVIQLRGTPPGDPTAATTGLARFAPALLIIAIGLLCAVLVDPVAGWIGDRSIRRGRLALALAGLHLGRRRSGSRLLSLVTVAVALLTFATTAVPYAENAQVREAGTLFGADQVVIVTAHSPGSLLAAVRSVDPAGDFAMAAQPVLSGDDTRTLMAVDAARLPQVAHWPDNAPLSAEQTAHALHPPLPAPIEVHGTGLEVEAHFTIAPVRFEAILTASVVRLDTGEILRYELVPPQSAGAPYTTNVACTGAGCRLLNIAIAPVHQLTERTLLDPSRVYPEVMLSAVRQTLPDRVLAASAELNRWTTRSLGSSQSKPTDTGLRVTLTAYPDRPEAILPPDTPPDIVLINSGANDLFSLGLQNGQQITCKSAGESQRLPRLGSRGTLTDLEYLLREGEPAVATGLPSEIWLGPNAPANINQRLTAAGLTVLRTERLSDQLAFLHNRPATAGLRFLLIAALAGLLLGAVGLTVAAGVERRTRSQELRALRIQGLAPRTVIASTLFGYVTIVALASVLGFVAGFAVWHATGAYLPILDSAGPRPSLPLLPASQAILAGTAGSAILIAIAAMIAIRLTRSSEPSHRAGTTKSPI